MTDFNTVCCMCGDVGFPDKLFQCARCFSRFQHSYCSNYYKDSTESAGLCDWCRCEEIKSSWKVNLVQSNKSSVGDDQNNYQRDEKNKYGVSFRQDGSNTRGRSPGVAGPSSRTPGRRYKLLKDVLS